MPSRVEVRIERLAIRMRGVPANPARIAVGEMGGELIRRLALLPFPAGFGSRRDLATLNAGEVLIPRNADARRLRDAMAAAVADSIDPRQQSVKES